MMEQAKSDANIKAYLEAFPETNIASKNTSPQPIDGNVIKSNIDAYQVMPASIAAIQNLNQDDLQLLANAFLQETDLHKINDYFWIFSQTPFPNSYQKLLDFAQSPEHPKYPIQEFACQALRYFKSDDVRALRN